MPDLRDKQRQLPPMDHFRSLEPDELKKIGDEATKLVSGDRGGDKFVNNVAEVIISCLQAYQVARTALSRRCIELDVSEEVEGWIVQSMRDHAGNEEIERRKVLEKTKNLLLPFLMAEYQVEGVREHEVVEKAEQAEEEQRRELHIDLPWRCGEWWGPGTVRQVMENGRLQTAVPNARIKRGDVVSVTGDPGAVKLFLDEVQRHAMTSRKGAFRPNVLRLVAHMVNHNVLYSKAENRQYFEVGVNRWTTSGAARSRLEKELTPWLRLLRKKRCDLLIVEDMAELVGGSDTLPPQQRAGMGLRNIARWANENGCAVVIAIPLERLPHKYPTEVEPPPLDNTWSNLDTYSELVQLVVEESDENNYRLIAQRSDDVAKRTVLIPEVRKEVINNWDWRDSDKDSGTDRSGVHASAAAEPVEDSGRAAAAGELRGGGGGELAEDQAAGDESED